MMKTKWLIPVFGTLLLTSPPAGAQEEAAPLAPFAWLDGEWRGEATVMTREGPITLTQTERSGELLGGRIRLVEGVGYDSDGSVAFNALGVIAPAAGGGFEMRSWTLDHAGTFPITAEPNGFRWETPGGPGATIEYRATFDGETWIEVGHRLVEGQPPVEIYRMALKRVGGGGWPETGAVAQD